MVNTNLEQYSVADFLDWSDSKRLELNPYFQRNSVWSPSAKTYLIDTILNDMPIPKIYLRSKIDLVTKKTIREVVDGQQRVRAILDFCRNKYKLSSRSKEFKGLGFDDLDEEQKTSFLSYSLSVDQLLNADDADILEVFSRLNSYSVRLNPAELRHAEFQGELKWGIVELAKKHTQLWSDYEILSLSRRARMLDYSLVAEMCQILIEGVKDGGQPNITKFYKRHDSDDFKFDPVAKRFKKVLDFIDENVAEAVVDSLASPPHFLMLFAAAAYLLVGIPVGDIEKEINAIPDEGFSDSEDILENLIFLKEIIDAEIDAPKELDSFEEKSASSTQRLSRRRIRFPVFVAAFQGSLK